MKKILFAFAGTLLVATFAFGGLTSSATSLHELRAKAQSRSVDLEQAPVEETGTYCTPNSNTDCKSSATGNIYAGYKAA